jgi:hypothetical protein
VLPSICSNWLRADPKAGVVDPMVTLLATPMRRWWLVSVPENAVL